jgi:hypothetical protein
MSNLDCEEQQNFQEPSTKFNSWKAVYLQEMKMLNFRMKNKCSVQFENWLKDQT